MSTSINVEDVLASPAHIQGCTTESGNNRWNKKLFLIFWIAHHADRSPDGGEKEERNEEEKEHGGARKCYCIEVILVDNRTISNVTCKQRMKSKKGSPFLKSAFCIRTVPPLGGGEEV